MPAFVSSLLLLPTPLVQRTSGQGPSVSPAMDLLHKHARIVGTRWRAPAATSGPGCGGPRPGRPRTSRPSFARTGDRPTAPRISSSATPRLPRTSPRRPSSPPCARSTASTGGARSGRGCTGSSSTARSTGRALARCGPRSRAGRRCRAPSAPRSATTSCCAKLRRLSPEHRAVIVLRYLLDYTPGEIAELLDLPRGTVNSRLRRGLDSLKERLRSVKLRGCRSAEREAAETRLGGVVAAARTRRASRWPGRAGTCAPLVAGALVAAVVAAVLSPPGRVGRPLAAQGRGRRAAPSRRSSPLPAPGAAAGDEPQRPLARAARTARSGYLGRYQDAALLASRPLHRRDAREPARRARPEGARALDARPSEPALPGLDGHEDGHAHRLRLARTPPRRGRRRHRRPADRRRGSRPTGLAARRRARASPTRPAARSLVVRRRHARLDPAAGHPVGEPPRKLAWSSDGRLLLVFTPHATTRLRPARPRGRPGRSLGCDLRRRRGLRARVATRSSRSARRGSGVACSRS